MIASNIFTPYIDSYTDKSNPAGTRLIIFSKTSIYSLSGHSYVVKDTLMYHILYSYIQYYKRTKNYIVREYNWESLIFVPKKPLNDI